MTLPDEIAKKISELTEKESSEFIKELRSQKRLPVDPLLDTWVTFFNSIFSEIKIEENSSFKIDSSPSELKGIHLDRWNALKRAILRICQASKSFHFSYPIKVEFDFKRFDFGNIYLKFKKHESNILIGSIFINVPPSSQELKSLGEYLGRIVSKAV